MDKPIPSSFMGELLLRSKFPGIENMSVGIDLKGDYTQRPPLTKKDFEWFDLKRYDGAEDMPLRAWFMLFSARSALFSLLEHHVPGSQLPGDQLVEKSALEWLLLPLGSKGEGVDFLKVYSTFPRSLVEEIRVIDAAHCTMIDLERMKPVADEIQAWRNWFSSCDGEGLEKDEPEGKYLLRSLSEVLDEVLGDKESREVVLTIRTNAPDDMIVEDFRRWLEAKRQRDNRKGKSLVVNEKSGFQWAQQRILPYLDIMIWCTLHKRAATHALVGELLFPGEDVDTTDRVRRTVKPAAERVLDPSFMDSFKEIVARIEAGAPQ